MSEQINYRPLNLTCVACKLLEPALCSNIRLHLDRNGVLCPNQHGFCKKQSFESQFLVTTHELLSRLVSNEKVDIATLDSHKAYNVVSH
jgi:hypothetical protein